MDMPDIGDPKQPELSELFSLVLAQHFRWDVTPPTDKQLQGQVMKLIEDFVREHPAPKREGTSHAR